MDTVSPWGFPIWYLSALFPYFLNTYAHSFLRTLVIYCLSFQIIQPFCLSVMLFSDITPKLCVFFCIWYIIRSDPIPFRFNSVYIFWLRSKILFCLNFSILCSYLFTFALFASILCFISSVTVFNPFFLTIYFSYSSFIFCFFFDPNFPFKSLVNNFASCLSFFISPSILFFYLGSFFSLQSLFFNPICSGTHTLQIIHFCDVFAFKILNHIINSFCLLS